MPIGFSIRGHADILCPLPSLIRVEENARDVGIETKFRAAFRGDISEKKKRAMQILLNGELDLSAITSAGTTFAPVGDPPLVLVSHPGASIQN